MTYIAASTLGLTVFVLMDRAWDWIKLKATLKSEKDQACIINLHLYVG